MKFNMEKFKVNEVFNYTPPITIYESITKDLILEYDNAIMQEIKYHVDVDKEELIKALNYDREQYYKGFGDCEKLLNKFERALDKACELLSLSMPYLPINKCPKDIDCFNGGHLKNKEEWKELCLKDDENI